MATHGNWKNQNPGCRFGATSWTALPIQPIHRENGPNGLNWQCCLAGSSKTAPRILIFSIAMGGDYLFYVKSIATYAPAFFGYNNSVLVRVVTRKNSNCSKKLGLKVANSMKVFSFSSNLQKLHYITVNQLFS